MCIRDSPSFVAKSFLLSAFAPTAASCVPCSLALKPPHLSQSQTLPTSTSGAYSDKKNQHKTGTIECGNPISMFSMFDVLLQQTLLPLSALSLLFYSSPRHTLLGTLSHAPSTVTAWLRRKASSNTGSSRRSYIVACSTTVVAAVQCVDI